MAKHKGAGANVTIGGRTVMNVRNVQDPIRESLALNMTTTFTTTGSGEAELREMRQRVIPSIGSFGVWNIEMDSYSRTSKLKMKEIVKRRMSDRLGILPAWECDSSKMCDHFAMKFDQDLLAMKEIVGNEGSGDSRYEGLDVRRPPGSVQDWDQHQIESNRTFNRKSVIFISGSPDRDIVVPAFSQRETKKVHCFNKTPSEEYFLRADSIFIELSSFPQTKFTAVPEFDLYLPWIEKKLAELDCPLREMGRSVMGLKDPDSVPPFIICAYYNEEVVSQKIRGPRSADTLRLIALAEYVAEQYGADFVHYQKRIV